MNNKTKELHRKIKDLICAYLVERDSGSIGEDVFLVVGILEDLKVGLLSASHETHRKEIEKEFKKDPSSFDSYLDKHKQQLAELLKKAKNREDTSDGTTSTAA